MTKRLAPFKSLPGRVETCTLTPHPPTPTLETENGKNLNLEVTKCFFAALKRNLDFPHQLARLYQHASAHAARERAGRGHREREKVGEEGKRVRGGREKEKERG